MQKIALSIITIGFVFVFFSVPAFGIDILLNPVGFLLIWNGLKALKNLYGGFKLAVFASLIAVFVTAIQLFAKGTLVQAMAIIATMALLALLFDTTKGIVKYLLQNKTGLNKILLWVSCILCSMASLFQLATLFFSMGETVLLINNTMYFLTSAFWLLLMKFSRFKDIV